MKWKSGKKRGILFLCSILLLMKSSCITNEIGAFRRPVYAKELSYPDGIYSIEGVVLQASSDQASMGESAFQKPFRLEIIQGKPVLKMKLKPVTSGRLTGYIGSVEYYEEYTAKQAPVTLKSTAATVERYFDVTDSYNDPTGGTDPNVKGKNYPETIQLPVTLTREEYWLKLYIPLMESISTGNGTQYARLKLDLNSVKQAESISGNTAEKEETGITSEALKQIPQNGNDHNNVTTDTAISDAQPLKTVSSGSKKDDTTNGGLNFKNLPDGSYLVSATMLKTDKKTSSMADEAIDHTVELCVKKGNYTLTVFFKGVKIATQTGYLSKVKYYKNDYEADKNGNLKGTLKKTKTVSVQTNTDGSKVADFYGGDYPKEVSFRMISNAKKDGYVPLQVTVPIMEALSPGSGAQNVYLKLDKKSVTKKDKQKGSRENTKSTNSLPKQSDNTGNGSQYSDRGTDSTNGRTSSSDVKKGNEIQSSLNTTADQKSAGSNENHDGAKSLECYTCKIIRTYRHPVSGTIEDTGGESGQATGQGMVESCIKEQGLYEISDRKEEYLTVRLGLGNYTGNHSFQVQAKGESEWKQTEITVTQTGEDQNGPTKDYCIKIPAKECVIRCSMYVEPMGRNVIFYFYPEQFAKGNTTDFKALHAALTETEDPGEGKDETQSEREQTGKNTSVESRYGTETKTGRNGQDADAGEKKIQAESETERSTETIDLSHGLYLSTQKDPLQIQTALPDPKKDDQKEDPLTDSQRLAAVCGVILSVMMILGLFAGGTYYIVKNKRQWKVMKDADDYDELYEG